MCLISSSKAFIIDMTPGLASSSHACFFIFKMYSNQHLYTLLFSELLFLFYLLRLADFFVLILSNRQVLEYPDKVKQLALPWELHSQIFLITFSVVPGVRTSVIVTATAATINASGINNAGNANPSSPLTSINALVKLPI